MLIDTEAEATAVAAVQDELPSWSVSCVHGDVGACWVAESPTFGTDGISIRAPTGEELIARVRSFVRALAIAMGRAGRLDPSDVLAGARVARKRHVRTGAPAPAPTPDGETVVRAHVPEPAPYVPGGRELGFEGDPCPECGAMMMSRNGSCLKCHSCGATTGCS